VCVERRLKESCVGEWPPPKLDSPNDVFLGHLSPVATVGAVVSMVAHHEVVRLLNNFWAAVFMASELWGHEEVRLEYFVDIYLAVVNPHGVTFLGDDSFDKRFVWIARVKQHHDVASLWIAKETVGCFVHDQPILVLEGWLHALALDSRDLESEGDDEGGVDRR
jgi:hypothetical protein